MHYDQITQFAQCKSDAERRQWPFVIIINVLLWILLLVCAWIFVLIYGLLVLLLGSIFAEYHVRNLQARGVTIGPDQFSDLHEAMQEVCRKFNYTQPVRLIILPAANYNAMALHFIRKRAIVVYSGLLESIIDDPAQVRALLAHELCHCKLNFAFPRRLLLYQSAKFRSARELTCDNAGLVASGDLDAAVNLLRKLCAGPQLSTMVSKSALIQEAELINSGFAGWVLRRFISHPPAGTRMKNLEKFSQEIELPLKAASSGVQPAVVAS